MMTINELLVAMREDNILWGGAGAIAPSKPTILQPQVRILSTTSTLFRFIPIVKKILIFYWNVKRTKVHNLKSAASWPF